MDELQLNLWYKYLGQVKKQKNIYIPDNGIAFAFT